MSVVDQRPTAEQVESDVNGLRVRFRDLQTDCAKFTEGLSVYGGSAELVERIRSELSDANEDLSRLQHEVLREMRGK